MERLVTQIVEEIVATVPGVEEMTSTSSEGGSESASRSPGAPTSTRRRPTCGRSLEDEIDELPDDIERPQIRKFDIASFPVVLLGISSPLDPVELTELIDEQVRYRFARLPGVAQVDLWGGYDREVRVELDPERVRALGLPLDRVLDPIRDANLDLPAGEIERGRYEVTLRAPAEFANLDRSATPWSRCATARRSRSAQIAEVQDTYERLTRLVRVNGERGLRMAIRKQADANTVEVSRRILAEIERVNRDFPQIEVVPVINQGNFIERSIRNVAHSVLYGGGLAVLVLLFFLRNLRSTIVISLAIPISIIATFALIYFGGFTLNLMTLGGLALGVGMMVDSSIVVLENIFRRRDEEGEDPEEASVEGAAEVGPAIVASTITTLVIFLPLVFVRGVSGILFQELAYVIVFSLVCSLLVSLSLVPMLASKLLSRRDSGTRAARSWIDRLAPRRTAFDARSTTRTATCSRVAAASPGHGRAAPSSRSAPACCCCRSSAPSSCRRATRARCASPGEMEVGTRLDLVDRQTRLHGGDRRSTPCPRWSPRWRASARAGAIPRRRDGRDPPLARARRTSASARTSRSPTTCASRWRERSRAWRSARARRRGSSCSSASSAATRV